MAWKQVSVKHGKKLFEGFQRGAEVALNPSIGSPKTIIVNDVSANVLDCQEDDRGELVIITTDLAETLADADVLEGESDDQPDEGRDTD